MGTDMSQKPTRRELLAFMALADAPVPESIRFAPESIYLDHDSIAHLRRWIEVLELRQVQMSTQRYPGRESDKEPTHTLANAYGYWRGQRIALTAMDPLTAPVSNPLDEATRAQLAQVAADAQILTEYVADGVTRVEHPA